MPMLLLTVVLVCPVELAIQDCTRNTALDVIPRPCSSAIPSACLAEGEALVASGAMRDFLPAGTRPRFLAERRRD
ncbi:hypothetical protein [Methylobacterium nodulans]|uniref:Uncharacterized protein n=1 Tax=Methylobacterium nodulans (strain LMG 21967 / CNCM I-2342 / ORS 2060) TaxID=460265 RepID=B8IDN2_METNO|nr:hypothetical protein [Methylobacterium nodulans]ACL55604.1 hypothetical protein Mnod_0567 [Methylobacterium nodulans ORS 2060]